MLRLLANQPISVLVFVLENILVPLPRLEFREIFLVLGQPSAKSSWARETTSFLSLALSLSKAARKVKLSVIWDVGVR